MLVATPTTENNEGGVVLRLGWVVLTMGDRWPETTAAVASLLADSPDAPVVLVLNGADLSEVPALDSRVTVVPLDENVGIPAGRAAGFDAIKSAGVSLVGFLDDDALLVSNNVGSSAAALFDKNPRLAVVSLRIQDEDGLTARRHIPRFGQRGETNAGSVAVFLGGASIVRCTAYIEVGGLWGELFYSHEELELSWRLHEAGYEVWYEPSLVVRHPKTEISRHADGWRLTGRNRVLIARRNLPLPVLLIHTLVWVAGGLVRAPNNSCRSSYLKGWRAGWRIPVDRAPISWSTVWTLTRLGRPPIC